jgi:erythronate-4-phosphate dehydrogenase
VIIVCDQNMPGLELLSAAGHTLRRLPGRAIDAAAVVDADALLVRSVTRVDAALLAGSRLRFVGTATSGVDHVDRAALADAGIAFAHAPGANANSVVEYVLAAVLAHRGTWAALRAGASFGIVGYGHIGRALRAHCSALGFRCKVYDPWLPAAELDDGCALEQVLGCTVVSLHAELSRREPWPSHHLLNADTLAHLSGSSLLINASRGPVVDNAALLRRLRKGRGPITVLDVWEQEPLVDPELLSLVSLATPHIAGYSWDSKLRASAMLLQAMGNVLGTPTPSLQHGTLPALSLPAAAAGLRDEPLARLLLRTRYRIDEDDLRLRTALRGIDAPAERAAVFDRLRRDYPRRRELAGSALASSPRWDMEQDRLLSALGVMRNGPPPQDTRHTERSR